MLSQSTWKKGWTIQIIWGKNITYFIYKAHPNMNQNAKSFSSYLLSTNTSLKCGYGRGVFLSMKKKTLSPWKVLHCKAYSLNKVALYSVCTILTLILIHTTGIWICFSHFPKKYHLDIVEGRKKDSKTSEPTLNHLV